MRVKCRIISRGMAKGEAIVSRRKFSFLGDVDIDTGVVIAEDSDVHGESIAGKVFVFPTGRGSTVGTYVLLRMKKRGTAPKAIINIETEPIIAVGAVIAEIPLVDRLEMNPLEMIKTGDIVMVNAIEGWVEVHGGDKEKA